MHVPIPITDQGRMNESKDAMVNLLKRIDNRHNSLWICVMSNGKHSVTRVFQDGRVCSFFPLCAEEEKEILPHIDSYTRFDEMLDVESVTRVPDMASVVSHFTTMLIEKGARAAADGATSDVPSTQIGITADAKT